MNSPDLTTPLIRTHYRRARGTLLVWSMAMALSAGAMTGAALLGWFAHGNLWAAAPALGAAVLLVAWFRRVRYLNEARIARELDERWQLSARLESAIELSAEKTALATAQRTEAAQRVAGRTPNSALWSLGLFAVMMAICFLGVEGLLLGWRAVHAGMAAASAPTQAVAAEETPASITWKSPIPEIKATPIEEVPLKAQAESGAGFRKMSLEIAVNGEPKLSLPLNAAAFGDASKPGSHEVSPLLALDEVGAKPYDIVSYHLAGERNAPGASRPVTSPLQFIQIKPLTEEIADRGRVSEEAMKMRSLIGTLKLAQLRLIEQNFRLAQHDDLKAAPEWKTANSQIATEQEALAVQAAEAAAYAREKNLPALLDKNLTEAAELMITAGKAIAKTENESARPPQGRALALITECEKLFGRAREIEGEIPEPLPMNDPFRDAPLTELPSRQEGPAGELEKLAQQQRQANEAAGAKSGPTPAEAAGAKSGPSTAPGQAGAGMGETEPTQDEIAREAKRLADSGELDGQVQEFTLSAANAAGAAARQMALGDKLAWREPAGAAQLALEQAVNAIDKAGRELAVAQLDQARRTLNSASRSETSAERVRQLAAVRDELRAAAVQQQRTGSAVAARELATLADLISAPTAAEGSKPGSPERAREAAVASARAQVTLDARATSLNRAIRQLNRAQQGLSGNGTTPGLGENLADAETASQVAEWLTADSTTIETARKLSGQSDAMQRSPRTVDAATTRTVATAASQLAAALENARNVGQRDEIVRRFNIEDIDPAYRAAVEAYFERLSREGTKPLPASPPPPAPKP